MKATDLAAALEANHALRAGCDCFDCRTLTEAARVMRDVAEVVPVLLHAPECWPNKCTCGLDRLRRVVGDG